MGTWDSYRLNGGLLIVLSGPSGVGKDTVLRELERLCPNVRRCVTTTTRARRQGEVDGVDYHFVSLDQFRATAEAGGFLEFAEVHGNHYGSPRRWVEESLAAGLDVVLKIDVQGGLAVKRQVPTAVMVFVVPPSMEELERRLRERLTESEEDLSRRLSGAHSELRQIPNYDYIVENGSIAEAVEELRAVIVAEHCRIR